MLDCLDCQICHADFIVACGLPFAHAYPTPFRLPSLARFISIFSSLAYFLFQLPLRIKNSQYVCHDFAGNLKLRNLVNISFHSPRSIVHLSRINATTTTLSLNISATCQWVQTSTRTTHTLVLSLWQLALFLALFVPRPCLICLLPPYACSLTVTLSDSRADICGVSRLCKCEHAARLQLAARDALAWVRVFFGLTE